MQFHFFPPSPNVRKVNAVISHLDVTPGAARVKQGEEQFRPFASLLNNELATRPFLVGNTVTLADFVVGGAVTYLERGSFPTTEFPHLQAWWARLNQIPAWKQTIPSADLPA